MVINHHLPALGVTVPLHQQDRAGHGLQDLRGADVVTLLLVLCGLSSAVTGLARSPATTGVGVAREGQRQTHYAGHRRLHGTDLATGKWKVDY